VGSAGSPSALAWLVSTLALLTVHLQITSTGSWASSCSREGFRLSELDIAFSNARIMFSCAHCCW